MNLKKPYLTGYMFDFDNNLFHLETKILLKDNDSSEIIEVTPKEYSEMRKNTKYSHFENSFVNFRDTQEKIFLQDVKEAISKNNIGPSFKKFKKCVISGQHYGIITARGNTIDSFNEVMYYIIIESGLFTSTELKKMCYNLIGFSKLFGEDTKAISNDYETGNYHMMINNYINQCFIYPVSALWFEKEFDINSDLSIEKRKEIAIEHFVKVRISYAIQIGLDSSQISFGMSDDDLSNIKSVEEKMTLLSNEYVGVKFNVYNTNNEKYVRKKSFQKGNQLIS